MKNLIKKLGDEFYFGLLAYCATPLSCGKSPAEILYNRKLQTDLSILKDQLYTSEKQSQNTEKQVKRNRRTTMTELHINYQSYKKKTS